MKIEMIEKTFKTKRFKWLKESSKQIQSENEVLQSLGGSLKFSVTKTCCIRDGQTMRGSNTDDLKEQPYV